MKRVPLWLTVVPLIVAVAGYWYVWNGYKNDFRAEIARVLPGTPVTIGGFPYRMEATVAAPRLSGGKAAEVSIVAERAILNRGPWQPGLTIIRLAEPRVSGQFGDLGVLDSSSFILSKAPSSESSLHIEDGRIVRFSTVIAKPHFGIALLGQAMTADKLEIHYRETPGRSAEAWSPTLPQRAQVVLAGEGIKTAGGAPLNLAADLRVTGPAKLVSYAAWAPKGTVEIHDLTLGDATGEVLRLNATLVISAGRPRIAGTILTNCPLSVRASLTGERVSEQRLRLPVTLALSGAPGAWQVGGVPEAGRAVRAQQPPCPVLR